MKRSIMEFMIHYLGDPSFRRAVHYRERTTLSEWGLDAAQIDVLVALEKDPLLSMFQEEVTSMIADATFMGRTDKALAEVGFDLGKAHDWIWGGQAPCRPAAAPLAAALYGEGDVHVREIKPGTVVAGARQRVTISGQGFSPRVAVGFALAEGATEPEVDGWIIDRHSDIDVHEYLVVEVELPSAGKWSVFVRRLGKDKTEDWRIADCQVVAQEPPQ